jgi:hypothetical protein
VCGHHRQTWASVNVPGVDPLSEEALELMDCAELDCPEGTEVEVLAAALNPETRLTYFKRQGPLGAMLWVELIEPDRNELS